MAEDILPAVVLLGAGLLAILASRAVHASPIIGFLLAGLAIGHHGLGWIEEGHTTHLLAELGVVFLLFDIGLHFSLRDVVERRRDILGLGPAQMAAAALVLGGGAYALGVPGPIAGLVGAALALSSTAVVVRTLAERGQQTCPLGRSATAVLIFQDIAAIFLLVLVSAPAGEGGGLAAAAASAAAKAAVAIAASLALGRFVVRPLFGALARTRSEEVFTGGALFLILAMAFGTASIGLSLTLGSFLAGMMIADSPYRHLVQTEARPFRNLLLGFFFMSVGMALDPGVLIGSAPLVLAAVAALLLVKTATTWIAARINGWSVAGATQLAFLLGQGSEFAFVVFASPLVAGALGAETTSVLVAAVAITLAATPAWAALGSRLGRSIADRRAPRREVQAAPPSAPDPVIVFGMTPAGRFAIDALDHFEVPTVAVETDPERFLEASAEGYDVAFGDLADLRLADAIGITHARALALAAPRIEVSRELTPVVRERYPELSRFVALPSEGERGAFESLGIHVSVNRGDPHGVEFATALLRDAGIGDASIAEWLESLRGDEAPARPEAA